MSCFRLVGLPPAPFEWLFERSDAYLRTIGALRVIADTSPGYPCRVSLQDATVGDELLLLPFPHQAAASPYQASGPLFVRRGAARAVLEPGEVPAYVSRRLISARAYDAADMMLDAEVCAGDEVADTLQRLLSDPRAAYVHLHNAKRGCFSCLAERVA